MYEVKCTIEGVPGVGLLHKRFPMPKDPGEPRPRKGKGDAESELEGKAYKDEHGMYLPADNIRMSLIGNRFRTGAAQILGSTIERAKGKKYRDFCKACVWVSGLKEPTDRVYFKPLRKTWDDVLVKSFITATGGRDVESRPMIRTPWSLTFTILVTDDTFTPAKIKELFTVAGLRCGLGDYGPTFGRFIITEWDVHKID